MRKTVKTLLFATACGALYFAWYWYHGLNPGSDTYEVKPGATLHALARELTERGVLPESRSFVLLASLGGHRRDLKAGEYRFAKGISASGILEQVVSGRVVEYPVVLVEGWTFRQFMQALDAAPKLAHTLEGLSAREIMARLGHSDELPEGRFFPDTYNYSRGQTDVAILTHAYERMQARLNSEWETRSTDLPYRTPYQALIMASIIEKETGRADERPMIAGVFINRLWRNMKLQTDPTVIYGLGDRYDGKLHLINLRTDTPYNTYTRRGLPPTPIAMPGASSLHAALHPADTHALYFVSRGDGTHVFSDNLEEHNQAVIKYQLNGNPKAFSSYRRIAPKTTTRSD